MKVSIKWNDAFRVVCDSLKLTEKQLESTILDRVVDEFGFLDIENCGKTIWKTFENLKYTKDEFIDVMFPKQKLNDEVKELLEFIVFWGDGTDKPCSECGCEMEGESDSNGKHHWTDWTCENPECGNKETNEPDWDTMPGGHDNF